MSLKVFDIIKEYRALEDLLNEVDSQTGEFINNEDVIKEYIENLNDTRDNKLDNIERLKREFEAGANALDIEIKRLQSFKKQKEKSIENLTSLQMILTQGEKIETSFYKFSTRKSKSVNIIDESLIPDDFFKIKKEVSKSEISKAINNGIDVSGAEIVEKISLTVK